MNNDQGLMEPLANCNREEAKFLLPSPRFDSKPKEPMQHGGRFLTPFGMAMLTREQQPPPMYGPRGATVPPKYLQQPPTTAPPKKLERHFCKPCEMELQSVEELHTHRLEHQQCPLENCSYHGHPMVMETHIAAVHAAGIYEKFRKMSTPEEIEAWREQRRKRFPTLANIEVKQRARQQRERRGERLGPSRSRFGRPQDRKRAHKPIEPKTNDNTEQSAPQLRRLNKRCKVKHQRSDSVPKPRSASTKSTQRNDVTLSRVNENGGSEEHQCGGIFMFRGTSEMQDYKHVKVKSINNNVLSGMLGMYGSSSEGNESSDEDVTAHVTQRSDSFSGNIDENNVDTLVQNPLKEIPSDCKLPTETVDTEVIVAPRNEGIECNTLKPREVLDPNVVPVNDNSSSDEPPEEVPVQRHSDYRVPEKPKPIDGAVGVSNQLQTAEDHPSSSVPGKHNAGKQAPAKFQHRERPKRKYGLFYRKIPYRKHHTLLEKLLEADIRHERNVLLQCVRFVCENNFFDVAGAKEANEP